MDIHFIQVLKRGLCVIMGISLCFAWTVSYAQSDIPLFNTGGTYSGGTAYAHDYQCLGINPANLGDRTLDKYLVTIGLPQVQAVLQSDALVDNKISNLFFDNKNLSRSDQLSFAQNLATRGVSANIDVMPIGVAVELPIIGGFAASWHEKIYTNFTLNDFASSLLFQGYHSSYFTNRVAKGKDTMGVVLPKSMVKTIGDAFVGTNLQYSWTREYTVGFGRRFPLSNAGIKLFLGADVKYVQGFNYMALNFTPNGTQGFVSLTGLQNLPYDVWNHPSYFFNPNIAPPGKGWGGDIGATVTLLDFITAGLSFVDIGVVKWQGSNYSIANKKVDSLHYAGASTGNVFSGAGDLLKYLKGSSLQLTDSRSVGLPAQLRFGVSVKFGSRLLIGGDMIEPLNQNAGNYKYSVLDAMAEIKLSKLLRLSAGLHTGGDVAILTYPAGLSFCFYDNALQVGINTADITYFIRATDSTASLGVATLRIRL